MSMRKAFVLKQASKNVDRPLPQQNQPNPPNPPSDIRFDTRILLIGGTTSKFLNYSDKNKIEVAHFFYPILYIQSLKTGTGTLNPRRDIKPENGYLQKIELSQQFSPQWIASMNHNYIVKSVNYLKKIDYTKDLETYDPSYKAFLEEKKHQQATVYEQMHVEIRVAESCFLNSQKTIYTNKNIENIADENDKDFTFKSTIFENLLSDKALQKLKNKKTQKQPTENQNKGQKEDKVNINEEDAIIQQLQSQPRIYENKETSIDEKQMVILARKLNEITIQKNELNKIDYIENLKTRIHVSQNQKLNGCYFTSISMLLDTVFPITSLSYQQFRTKPKPKPFFWEITKHYNAKPNQNQSDLESSTQSFAYESFFSKIIFNQEFIKCLAPNGEVDQFFSFTLNSKPLHLQETDTLMNIYWKQGSTKLIIYDNVIQRFLQVQMVTHHDKKERKIISEIGQIKSVFYNNKDQHIYIYVEQEWQYNYKNVLMRAPLQYVQTPYHEIVFSEEICKQNIAQSQITFSIDSNDKIFGILKEPSKQFMAEINKDFNVSLDMQKTFILYTESYKDVINCKVIFHKYLQICGNNIENLEIDCFITGDKTDDEAQLNKKLALIPLYLGILNRNAQLIVENYKKDEVQESDNDEFNIDEDEADDNDTDQFQKKIDISQVLEKLENTLKTNQRQKNNFETSQFKSLKIKKQKYLMMNQKLIEIALEFLCDSNVRQFISSSFSILSLGGLLMDGSCFSNLVNTEYKIQFLDISDINVNSDSCYNGILEFLEKKGQFLKYLNISKQRNLLGRIIKGIENQQEFKFDSLIFLDISDISMISKFILIDLIQFLLHSCFKLQGINMNKIFEEGTEELLVSFDDLSKINFSSYYPSDYDLQIFIEKSGANQLPNNDTKLIDSLKAIFGDSQTFTANDDQRFYQNLRIKSKKTQQEAQLSERIAKIYHNMDVFQHPIVFSSETRYLIFERHNELIKEKEHYYFTFNSVLQDQVQSMNIASIKNDEVVHVIFKKQYFRTLTILNISKYLSNDSEKFTIFGVVEYTDTRRYLCRMNFPVPTKQDITQDNIQFFKSKSNIKNYTNTWIDDCYIPVSHNKKIKNSFLCVKDVYQQDGYSFFKADELQELN